MQRSPISRQRRVDGAQRATPSGPTLHTCEQQAPAPAQRSPSGLQPGSAAHREGPPATVGKQRAPQQSLSFMQISESTRHPDNALQLATAAGPTTHWAPQQSASPSQLSPVTRHEDSSWQRRVPLSPACSQSWPQQSGAPVQSSPAGRQSGAGPAAPQRPAMHTPSQQSRPTTHAPPITAQAGGPQRSPAPHPSAQQAPARAQDCPSEAQPAGFRQTCAPSPVALSPHSCEQQSEPERQATPSG